MSEGIPFNVPFKRSVAFYDSDEVKRYIDYSSIPVCSSIFQYYTAKIFVIELLVGVGAIENDQLE